MIVDRSSQALGAVAASPWKAEIKGLDAKDAKKCEEKDAKESDELFQASVRSAVDVDAKGL